MTKRSLREMLSSSLGLVRLWLKHERRHLHKFKLYFIARQRLLACHFTTKIILFGFKFLTQQLKSLQFKANELPMEFPSYSFFSFYLIMCSSQPMSALKLRTFVFSLAKFFFNFWYLYIISNISLPPAMIWDY